MCTEEAGPKSITTMKEQSSRAGVALRCVGLPEFVSMNALGRWQLLRDVPASL